MLKILIVLLIALVLEAVGVVLLSRGLKEIGELEKVNLAGVLGLMRRGLLNPSILMGVGFEAVFFGALLYLLSQRDVSLIWPLTSLGFVITAVAARWLLHEHVSWVRWSGVMLIVLGAALVSYSETLKPGKDGERAGGEEVGGQGEVRR
jgi:drug/metabolite transporter (DMT)-like permease